MFSIPYTFANEDESYITIPALKKFAREKRKEDLKTTVDRPQLIQDIENYANQSPEKEEEVLEWLDHVLIEGIKDVQIKLIDDDSFLTDLLSDDEYVKKIMEPLIVDENNRHLNKGYSSELRLFRYEITNEWEYGRRIRLYMGKLLCTFDKKHGSATVPYPIAVDIYCDMGIITSRSKSKSGLYKYAENFVLEAATSTKSEKETAEAIRWVCEKLSIATKKSFEAETVFKSRLYCMLERYTQTPKEIIELMDQKNTEINGIVDCLMHKVCNLKHAYEEDVKSNVLNMVEKYFSISYPDKNIFIKDREAYPLKLNATDEEDSKVEQTAALEEPLQSKAIFFDNKKMLQKSQACDGVTFMFARNKMYCSKQFKVKIVVNKDYCILKFTEYTMEEDIIHVLFSLISTAGNAE
ncbi:hypothetical protein GKG47_17635 [Lactonifactor sp. BIOML-A3]|uniref:hypothetical protein n=1 Tax=unclassified Lactonifactor TaxID=2636670 RepID=UPI0012B0E4DC|nr:MULTISPECIES: hypothetical protein [unclassified Lactonifactor]MSA03358.1 hypothetical protein [Lactonifactor sp. BIOML-A5]MSA09707.1 hypothetical protein [Lactonifactor sp. BIOML-A4]MSA14249.1 hypothetical protein [Lactonifactor sp. BIOML-A3]MSA18712.1 hypothetical protein [Lactonifactor sp. BIOML-A2]MSA39494.1 hypothetical protein [Lactonifactor sp. BIOML-A1]